MIYGASGYMGKLFARELVRSAVRPVLAGRGPAVERLAQDLGCRSVIFGIENRADIAERLKGVSILVNLAAPFADTQNPLVSACVASGTHYIDIAGEVDEMRRVHAFDQAARGADVMLMPGAGFGVVPTDIAANIAKQRLPDATMLRIAYATEGGASRGTLRTVLRDIDRPGIRIVEGSSVVAAPGETRMEFAVGARSFSAVYNPWRADLFTAAISTGIPNISTYSAFPGFIVSMMSGRLLWLRDLMLHQLLRFFPEGPSARQLLKGATFVEAVADNGTATARVAFKGPEAYLFTALCLKEIVVATIAGHWTAGFQTPAYYGKDLLDRVGVEWS
ncbi:MAG TPA: saccharopine dehydrogenase NADP-binding domain-containing protein [Ramlibacter sp.]